MAWDETMRTSGLSDKKMAQVVLSRFESGDTKDGIKFSLGGLYVYPTIGFEYVSKDAIESIKRVNPEAIIDGVGVKYSAIARPSAKSRKRGNMNVRLEHIIPVEALYQHLSKLKKLTVNYIVELMPLLKIAVIKKEEDKKLKVFNDKMPEGWWESNSKDPLERYRKSGLKDSIWVVKPK